MKFDPGKTSLIEKVFPIARRRDKLWLGPSNA
jgi:hypothetical protein